MKRFIKVLKNAGSGFIDHKIMKLSASLAYYTVFSIGPLLLVILFLCDFFWGREAIEGTIYNQIKGFTGESGAAQVQGMIQNLAISNIGSITGVIGIVTLIIGATSVFAEIQDSINTIWSIKPKKRSGIWLFLKARLLSFGVIGSLGFLLLVSLGISGILDGMNARLATYFSESIYYLIYIINTVFNFLVITLLFGIIFTILPDAKIKWKQIKYAAVATALLFIIGKFLISFYIAKSNISSVYGAAGSFVVGMVWVYYSSVILYFGAEFAKCYALEYADPIEASEYATITHTIEVPSEKNNLQDADKEIDSLKKKMNLNR